LPAKNYWPLIRPTIYKKQPLFALVSTRILVEKEIPILPILSCNKKLGKLVSAIDNISVKLLQKYFE
jgi:hypothetical protein